MIQKYVEEKAPVVQPTVALVTWDILVMHVLNITIVLEIVLSMGNSVDMDHARMMLVLVNKAIMAKDVSIGIAIVCLVLTPPIPVVEMDNVPHQTIVHVQLNILV